MKTIIALNYSHLKNAQHFNFMDFTKTAITLYNLASGAYDKYITKFLAAFEAEDEAYQKYDRKTLTARIAEQNVARQVKVRLLRDIIDSFRRTAGETKRLAAERLLGAMDLYGGVKIASLPMDQLTGVLTNLVEDFTDKYEDDVQLLEIGPAVANLRAENEAFKQLISERTQADSEIGKEAMAKARAESDRTLRMLFDAINLDVEFGDAEASLEPFIAYMNTEIDRYRIQIGQGSGTTKPKPDDETDSGAASGGTAGVVTKNATFVFIGGRKEVFPVEVGTVLIAPTNTTGYKWKPAIPELMPATNKTFKEVPIEDREVTLTFHFLSHEEEELRGIVGTALTALANTDGCYWEPPVPEVFPAEDTSYYEVVIPAEEEEEEEEDERPKYRITFRAGGSLVAIKEYHEGETIVPPECPEGFRWPDDMPTVMPAQNVTVRAEGLDD